MKRLWEYTVKDIHDICHGMPIFTGNFIITTYEVARDVYIKNGQLTIGTKENQVTGFFDLPYHKDFITFNDYWIACEKKLHDHFELKTIKLNKSRLELIMD